MADDLMTQENEYKQGGTTAEEHVSAPAEARLPETAEIADQTAEIADQTAEIADPEAEEPAEAEDSPDTEESEEERTPEVDGNRETFSFLIRGLAGAYIIYLAYKILKDMIDHNDVKWYMVLVSVIFIGAGGLFIFWSLKYFRKVRDKNIEAAERKEKEALEKEKLYAEHPELRPRDEVPNSPYGSGQAAGQGRRGGLFGALAAPQAAAENQRRSLTGSDIRERLRQMNEEDGLETEDITDYETDEAIAVSSEGEDE